MPAPIAIQAKAADDSSFFDEYDENDGPDIGAGQVLSVCLSIHLVCTRTVLPSYIACITSAQ